MVTPVTVNDLEQQIVNLNNKMVYDNQFHVDCKYALDIAYGGYRLVKRYKSTAETDVSPRLTKRELSEWIKAYDKGINAVLHNIKVWDYERLL